MTKPPEPRQLAFAEFVILMAVLTSLIAFAIDAMLPALPAIGQELNVGNANDTQFVVTVFFFGFAIGQLFYGPVSDSTGRKPAIYAGLALFIAGGLMSAAATDYSHMLLGRALQGFGAAGPRTVAVAMIRDRFSGRGMARVMSFVMAVFVIVPALAPSIGQAILGIANWRAIFAAILGLAMIGLFWLALRQPETLRPEDRHPFSVRRLAAAMVEILRNRHVIAYSVTGGMVFGAFIGYLASSQQIFEHIYGVGDRFPLYFAALALCLGAASILNSRLVMRFGMRLLCVRALNIMTVLSCLFLLFIAIYGGVPPLWSFMLYAMGTFFCVGTLFGNLVALAMEPLGHIAGIGSALIGALTTFISLLIGGTIGLFFDGSVLPLVTGFTLLSIGAFACMTLAGKNSQNITATNARFHRNYKQ